MGDPVFVHMGPSDRPRIGPAQCPPCVVKPRPRASNPRPWRPGGGGAAVWPGPSISCSHVQAAGTSLPGNSQSFWAIKSACGHPGIRSGTPGSALRALRQVCLRVRGSLQGAEPAGRGKAWLLHKRLRPIPGAPGTLWPGVRLGWAPSTHRGSEVRFIDTLSSPPGPIVIIPALQTRNRGSRTGKVT